MLETSPQGAEAAAGPLEFEERLNRLREITARLEKGRPSLEESLALYKEGVSLAAHCRQILEQAEHTVRLHTEEGLKEFTAPNAPNIPDRATGGNSGL